ncbi:MAG: leucine-rich repeat protein [Clostridia bacterium]|nr:leucine-rich repeat protein [Clostridia bacterium]
MKKIISILLVAMLALSSAIAVNAEGIKDVFGNGVKDLEARGATLVESGDYNDTGVIWEYYDDGSFIVKKGPNATSGTTSGDKATWRKYMGNITSLVFEDGITDIAAQAFGGCSNIETLTIADTVTTVGSGAFGGCTGLVSVDMGNGVTTLSDSLFGGCQKLVSFVIGDGLTALPNAMFGGCTSLKTVTLGNNIKTIGDNNFGGCSSLESFVIPDSVTSIGTNNFSGCNSLTSLTIGSGLQSIGDKLAGGAKLTSITISPQNTSFVLEDNLLLTADGKELIKATVQSTGTIPDTVETIRGYAFEYTNVTSVVIPSSVKSIGEDAFYYSDKLTSVVISDGVTTIGDGAFYGCSNLTSVEIPSSVTSIASNAFSYCSSDLVISGEPGSYAESYCNSKGITFESSTSEVKASGDYNGNLRWTLYEDGTFVLSGKGSSSGDLGNWRDYMYDITSVVYLEGITDVADYAFDGCSNIKTLTIPKTATSISFNSFNNCNGLENLNINCNLPGTAYFCNRNSLKSVTFGEGVTTISDYCFQNCSNLTLVTFPSTLTSIGSYVFYGCSNLSTATLPSKLTSIGQYAFNGCRSLESVAIPSGVTSINDGTFGSCINLTSLTIPEGVTSIGYGAFSTCPNLPSLTIPASVTNLNSGAFSSCYGLEELTINCEMTNTNYFNGISALKSLTFGPAVTKIPDYSFQSCSSLASVTIPATVTSIGRSAFYGCSNLTSATIPASVTSIGTDAFKNCSADLVVSGETNSVAESYCNANNITFKNQFGAIVSGTLENGAITWYITEEGKLVITGSGDMTDFSEYAPWYSYKSSITSIEIENGITSIGNKAFYKCTNLTSVSIPDSVTSIGSQAFAYFSGKLSIEIPDSVTSIDYGAFSYCSGEISLEIPDTVTSMGNYLFEGATGLISVRLPSSMKAIKTQQFINCKGLTSIEIPEGVTSIGDQAFKNCASLKKVIMRENVTSIGDDAFIKCPKELRVYGYYDTFAEEYCKSKGITFVPLTPVNHTVSFDANGGKFADNETVKSMTKTYGEDISLSSLTPTLSEQNFLGWSTSKYGYSQSDAEFTSVYDLDTKYDTVIYAVWEKTVVDSGETGANGNNLNWYITDDGTLYIYGKGDMSSISIQPWLSYHINDIKSVVIDNGVTNISNDAFKRCINLEKVKIPDSVTSIGSSAFEDCSSLASVDIPGSVTTIGSRAFIYCAALSSVDIEDGVTIISDNAFRSCELLKTINIPDSVTTIGNGAFHSCRSLTPLVIPDGVKSIGNTAFYGCHSLTSVEIPSSVTSIGNNAFAFCTALTSVNIPSSVTSLGVAAFAYCTALSSIDIEDGVTTIPASAFLEACSLTSIDIPDTVTTIESRAFERCTMLSSVDIPDSVTTIGSGAFGYCNTLTSIDIPESVTTISDSAFKDCSHLKSVYIYGDNTSMGATAVPDYTIVVAPKPSKAYDYCSETNTLSRFMEFGATYDITLDVNGGTLPAGTSTTITKTVGTPIASLPTPTRDNDEFIGWSTNNTLYGIFNSDILNFEVTDKLYAIWADDVAFDEVFKDSSFYYEGDNNVVEGYEDTKIGKLNGEYSNTWIKQSARWMDESKTTAEIRVDYSYALYEPKDVVFVLDVSGSMTGSKFTTMIDIVEKMSASVLTQIKGSRVAFTTFGDDLESSLDFTDDLQKILIYLNAQIAEGNTDYSAGLEQARNFIRDRKDKSRDAMLLFFSDGYPNLGNKDSNGIYGGAEATAIKALGCPISSVYLGNLGSDGREQLDAISTTPDMVYSANDESKLLDAFTSAFYSAAHPNEISISIDTARFTTSATTASGGEYGDSVVTIKDNVITWDVSKLKASTPYYITIPLQLVANPESGGPRGASETYPTSLEGNSIARVMDMARGNEVVNEVETPILSANQEEASYIRYYDGSTLLQESIIYDGATTHTLTEAPITSAEAGANVEDGLPVRSGYLFAGWYTTDLTVGTTNGTAFPETITIADYDDADGNLNLYAAWVPVGTVTKDGKDKNSYGGSSLKGFSLEGVQIRSKEVADKYQPDMSNTDQDALRFVTVYRNGMLEELQSLKGKSVSYGYTAYAKTDIANLTKLNKKTTGAVDIDCTKEGDQNHRMFGDYRLSTLVIKYDGADAAYKGDLVEARAYVDYTDANGFGRRGYHTYSDSKFAGGCRTSFDNAWSAVSNAYDKLAKIA